MAEPKDDEGFLTAAVKASDAHRRRDRDVEDVHEKKTQPQTVVLQRGPREGSDRPEPAADTIYKRATSPPPSLEYSGAESLKTLPPPPEYTTGAPEDADDAPPPSSIGSPSTQKRLRTGALFGRGPASRPSGRESSGVIERNIADRRKDDRTE